MAAADRPKHSEVAVVERQDPPGRVARGKNHHGCVRQPDLLTPVALDDHSTPVQIPPGYSAVSAASSPLAGTASSRE